MNQPFYNANFGILLNRSLSIIFSYLLILDRTYNDGATYSGDLPRYVFALFFDNLANES